MSKSMMKRVIAFILVTCLVFTILPVNTLAGSDTGDKPQMTILAKGQLTEDTLDGAVIEVNLSGLYFNSKSLKKENFKLNNAPAGITIRSVEYITVVSCKLILDFGGDFDSSTDKLTLTILAAETTLGQNITSANKISVTAINDKESLNAVWQEKGAAVDSIYEGEESLHTILATIDGGVLVSKAPKEGLGTSTDIGNGPLPDMSKWKVINLPEGLSVKTIQPVDSKKVLIFLDGRSNSKIKGDISIQVVLAKDGYSETNGIELISPPLTIKKSGNPIVETKAINNIQNTTAELYAEILNVGSPPYFEKGFIASEDKEILVGLENRPLVIEAMPGITMYKDAGNAGDKILAPVKIVENSSIYYRAYASSSAGTGFGRIKQLRTLTFQSVSGAKKGTGSAPVTIFKKVYAQKGFSLDLAVGDDIPDETMEYGLKVVNKDKQDGSITLEGIFRDSGTVILTIGKARVLLEVLEMPDEKVDTGILTEEDRQKDSAGTGEKAFTIDLLGLSSDGGGTESEVPEEIVKAIENIDLELDCNYRQLDDIQVGFEAKIDLGFAEGNFKRLDVDHFTGSVIMNGFQSGNLYEAKVSVVKKKLGNDDMFELTADLPNPLSDIRVVKDILDNEICSIGGNARILAQFVDRRLNTDNPTGKNKDKIAIRAPIQLKLDPTRDKLRMFAMLDMTNFDKEPNKLPITFGLEEGFAWTRPFSIVPGDVQLFSLGFLYDIETAKASKFKGNIVASAPEIGLINLVMPEIEGFGMPAFFEVDIPNLKNLLNPLFDLLKSIGIPSFKLDIQKIRIPFTFPSLGSLDFEGIDFRLKFFDLPKMPDINLDLSLPELDIMALINALKVEISFRFMVNLFGLLDIHIPEIGEWFRWDMELVKLEMKRASKLDFDGSVIIKYLNAGSDYKVDAKAKMDPVNRKMVVTAKIDNPITVMPIFKPFNDLGAISTDKKLNFEIHITPEAVHDKVKAKLNIPFDFKLDPTAPKLKMFLNMDFIEKTVAGGLREGEKWNNPFGIIPGTVKTLALESNPQFTDYAMKASVNSNLIGDMNVDLVCKTSGGNITENKIKIGAKNIKPMNVMNAIVQKLPVPGALKDVFDEVTDSFKIKELSASANAMDMIKGKMPSFKMVWQINLYGAPLAEQTIRLKSTNAEDLVPALGKALYEFVEGLVTGKVVEVMINAAMHQVEEGVKYATEKGEEIYTSVSNAYSQLASKFQAFNDLMEAMFQHSYNVYKYSSSCGETLDKVSAAYMKEISDQVEKLGPLVKEIPDEKTRMELADKIFKPLEKDWVKALNNVKFDYKSAFYKDLSDYYLNIARDRVNEVKQEKMDQAKAWISEKKYSLVAEMPEKKLVYRSTDEYEKVWDNSGVGNQKNKYSIWRPVAKDGFYPLSYVVTNSYSKPTTKTVLAKGDSSIMRPLGAIRYKNEELYKPAGISFINTSYSPDFKYTNIADWMIKGKIGWNIDPIAESESGSFVAFGQQAVTTKVWETANKFIDGSAKYWENATVPLPVLIRKDYVDVGTYRYVSSTENTSLTDEQKHFSNVVLEAGYWRSESGDGINVGGMFMSTDKAQPPYQYATILRKGTYISEEEAAQQSATYLNSVSGLLAEGKVQEAKEKLDIGIYYSMDATVKSKYAKELDFIKYYQEGEASEALEAEKKKSAYALTASTAYKKAYAITPYDYVKTRVDTMDYQYALYQGKAQYSEMKFPDALGSYATALNIYPERDLPASMIDKISELTLKQKDLLLDLDVAISQKAEADIISIYLEARSLVDSPELKAYENELPKALTDFISGSSEAVAKSKSFATAKEAVDLQKKAMDALHPYYPKERFLSLPSSFIRLNPYDLIRYAELKDELYKRLPLTVLADKDKHYHLVAENIEELLPQFEDYAAKYPELEKDMIEIQKWLELYNKYAKEVDDKLMAIEEDIRAGYFGKVHDSYKYLVVSRKFPKDAQYEILEKMEDVSWGIMVTKKFLEKDMFLTSKVDLYKEASKMMKDLKALYGTAVEQTIPIIAENVAEFDKIMDAYRTNNVSSKNSSTLKPGQFITGSGVLKSPNGQYQLKLTEEGPQLLKGSTVVWKLEKIVQPSAFSGYLFMGYDGNLSYSYHYQNYFKWKSGTAGAENAYMRITDSGKLQILSAEDVVLWTAKMVSSGSTYQLKSKSSGKYIATPKGSTANGNDISIWEAGNDEKQYSWKILSVSDGKFKIVRSDSTGKGMSVKDKSYDTGAKIHLWDYKAEAQNYWVFESVVGNYFRIRNANSNRYLDIKDKGTGNGKGIVQSLMESEEDKYGSQLWLID